MSKGRNIQIAKTMYWDDISDNHKCYECKKTKHDKVNFRVNVQGKYKSVERYCNRCRLDRIAIKKKSAALPKLTKKETISEGFKLYFIGPINPTSIICL